MFFFLSKILTFLIYPFTWASLLLVLSFITKKDKLKKQFRISSVIILLFFSNGFISDEFMRAWEIPAIKPDQIPANITTAIVLGGNVSYDEQLDRVQFSRGGDRLLQAYQLYKKGIIKKIIFTGGSASILFKGKKEAFYVQKYLTDIGMPPEDLLIEPDSKNTHENALFTKKIIDKEFPGQQFLLVTSAFHMRRSVGCFEKVGIKVLPYSADRYSGPRLFLLDHLLLPTAEAMSRWNLVIHEWVGCVTYKIKGYI